MSIDFEKFAVNAIKTIDELRSTNADPNNKDNNSTEPVESRINTFYRAVGLPAFTTDKSIDKFNNGNLFETDPEDLDIKKFIRDANERENRSSEKITEEEQMTQLDEAKDTILSSLKKFGEGGRKKGGLFPMIVNGNIIIMPQNKRVGGAFFQKDSDPDLTISGITYRRPLIELIVLLRLRAKGFVNDTDKTKLQNSFEELRDDDFFEGIGENLLTIQVLRSLLKTIVDPEGVVKFIYSTVKKLGEIRKEVRDFFKDSEDAVVVEEQPRMGTAVDNKGKLEQQIARKEVIKSEGEAMITLLEYDDTLDVTLRTTTTKNMKNALFAPAVLDAMLSDTREIDKSIKESKEKKETIDRLHKKLNKNMDLILGTYGGISGIDVLVIITALFSIEESHLLGLLNKESLDRLAKLKSTTVDELPGHSDKFEAIESLQSKVEEILKILNKKAKNPKYEEKIRSEL